MVSEAINLIHQPVLLDEVLSFVPKTSPITYLDMTLGRAGHAKKIFDTYKVDTFIGVDRDYTAIEYCEKQLEEYSKTIKMFFLNSKFSEAISSIRKSGYISADLILMDIGVSSPQFDDPTRGFSYRFDSKLDMRMDEKQSLTAEYIVNNYSEDELNRVFSKLGECKVYKPVSRKIVEYRKENRIETTFQLVSIIKDSLPSYILYKEGHPAKQFFLGLRYEVNDEINELKKGIKEALKFLSINGRLIVISFNSEEDRIVKEIFKENINNSHKDKYKKNVESNYIELTKKPILPTTSEIKENNRAKSSIMRVIERRK